MIAETITATFRPGVLGSLLISVEEVQPMSIPASSAYKFLIRNLQCLRGDAPHPAEKNRSILESQL